MTDGYIKVLLVEDDKGDADYLKELLSEEKRHSFNLECVERLQAGLYRLAKGGIDVVLLDLSLPDSDGVDTLARVYTQAPGVPIVVLTGLDDEALAVKAVRAGAQDYLVKGQTDSNLLVRAMRYAIERGQMQAELKLYTSELQSSEVRFRKIIEENADGIIIVDRNGIVRFVNTAAEFLFDRKAEKLLDEMFRFPVVAGETTELDIVGKHGEIVVAEMRVVETSWDGEMAYLASLRDITQLKEVDRMKSEFISVVSHELRTPLASIKNAVSIIHRGTAGPINDEQARFTALAMRNIDRLVRLINDILDIERIEAQRMELKMQRCAMESLIEAVLESFALQVQKKQIQLETDVSPNLPRFDADMDRIEQVLTNLIGNAIKFTSSGGKIQIRCDAVCGANSRDCAAEWGGTIPVGGLLRVSVADTGSGIEEAEIKRIFDKFHQIRGSYSGQADGTGLGLPIAKGIVETHGGKMWAKSTVGKGSEFVFVLPLENSNKEKCQTQTK